MANEIVGPRVDVVDLEERLDGGFSLDGLNSPDTPYKFPKIDEVIRVVVEEMERPNPKDNRNLSHNSLFEIRENSDKKHLDVNYVFVEAFLTSHEIYMRKRELTPNSSVNPADELQQARLNNFVNSLKSAKITKRNEKGVALRLKILTTGVNVTAAKEFIDKVQTQYQPFDESAHKIHRYSKRLVDSCIKQYSDASPASAGVVGRVTHRVGKFLGYKTDW